MFKDKILYLACFGFATGVLWRSFTYVGFKTIFLFGLIYISLILFFSLILKKNWDIFISFFIIAFLFGILRFHLADVQPPAAFESQVNKSVSVSALIVDEPAKKASQVKLIVETNTEIEANAGTKTSTKLSVETLITGIKVNTTTKIDAETSAKTLS